MREVGILGFRVLAGLLLFLAAAALLEGVSIVPVENSAQSPMVQFALGKLDQALQTADHATASSITQIRLRVRSGSSESYAIQNSGSEITVNGGDDRGLMYGILRLAEEIRLGKRLNAITDESRSPFIAIRAFKFNLPLPGTLYLSERNLKSHKWFWSMDYWRNFLDTLAEDRYNALELWSAEPWSELIQLQSYPEASSLPRPQLEHNIEFFRKLFRMAKNRGIDTYVVTWNIDLAPAFAQAHHLPMANVDTPLVRDYLRDCVKTLLQTYPDLDGFGTTQGEQMDVIPVEERAHWIADVYFRGIEETGRTDVPFILRYWGGAPEATEKVAAMYHAGPVYLDIKYNGEHAYSSPEYHVKDAAWLKQTHVYKLLWHLRNDDIYTLRWGDPEFVRELMSNMEATQPAGFTYGSEDAIPGQDDFAVPPWNKKTTCRYEFQKHWFQFALWGRLAYDPALPNDLWRQYFRVYYGVAGDALYNSTVAAGHVAPLITSFHWNYMANDWSVEGSIGAENTSGEQPRLNYRRLEMYHGIRTYIFNNTIDETFEDIPTYVARVLTGRMQPTGIRTPLDVANALEWDGHAALGVEHIQPPGGAIENAFLHAKLDDHAYGNLSLYYAEKIRGAVDLALFLFSNRAEYKDLALEHLRVALGDWNNLVSVTKEHYRPREIWLFGRFHWSMYTRNVEKDISIAQQMPAYKLETQIWQVAEAGVSKPQWKSVILQTYNSFHLEGMHSWLVYANQQFNEDKIGPGLRRASSIIWKKHISVPAGRRAVIEFAISNIPPIVRVNGEAIGPIAHGIRGVEIYWAGRGGDVEINAPAGLVPQESLLLAGDENGNFEVPAGAAEKIDAPLFKTSDDSIRFPSGLPLSTIVHSTPDEELNTSGTTEYLLRVPRVLYTFRTRDAGIYKISCRVRLLTQPERVLYVTVDGYNGQHDGKVTGRPSAKWEWVNLAQPIAIGPGVHTLEISFFQPGSELGRVRIEAIQGPSQFVKHR